MKTYQKLALGLTALLGTYGVNAQTDPYENKPSLTGDIANHTVGSHLVEDFTGDGILDMMVAAQNPGQNVADIWLTDGATRKSTLIAKLKVSIDSGIDLYAKDTDADGKLDFTAATKDPSAQKFYVYAFRNLGNYKFENYNLFK